MIIPKHLTPIVYVVNTEPRILLNSFQFFSRNLFYKLNNEQTWRMRWTLLGSRSDRYKQSGTVMKRGCETGNRFPIKVVHYPSPKTLLKKKGETTRVNNKYARRCAGVVQTLYCIFCQCGIWSKPSGFPLLRIALPGALDFSFFLNSSMVGSG